MIRALAIAAVALLAACGGTRWQGPKTDHFDGRHFLTPAPFEIGALDMVRYWRESTPGVWTRDMAISPGPKPVERVADGELRITFVNHATVLI